MGPCDIEWDLKLGSDTIGIRTNEIRTILVRPIETKT